MQIRNFFFCLLKCKLNLSFCKIQHIIINCIQYSRHQFIRCLIPGFYLYGELIVHCLLISTGIDMWFFKKYQRYSSFIQFFICFITILRSTAHSGYRIKHQCITIRYFSEKFFKFFSFTHFRSGIYLANNNRIRIRCLNIPDLSFQILSGS